MAKIDGEVIPSDLLTAEGVCEFMNWRPKTLDTYVYQYKTFPEPDLMVGRARLWERRTVKAWSKNRNGS